jgi:hypothetical protein
MFHAKFSESVNVLTFVSVNIPVYNSKASFVV